MVMLHLGFPVRIVGRPSLRSHDGRRRTPPHLSVSLIYLRDILHYLQTINVRFYRIASALLPTYSYKDAIHQLDECQPELAFLASQVHAQHVRLTLHLGYHITLTSEQDETVADSIREIELQAMLLDALGTKDGVLVLHVNGSAAERHVLQRFVSYYALLSPRARAYLAVEHDDTGITLPMLLQLHQACGVPVIFDLLHYRLNNPERLPLEMALGLALATWPTDRRPKIHVSTPRSEAFLVPATDGRGQRVVPPRTGQHADFITATDMLPLLAAAQGLPPFDIMIEAKAGDVALLRLRAELARIAPEQMSRLA